MWWACELAVHIQCEQLPAATHHRSRPGRTGLATCCMPGPSKGNCRGHDPTARQVGNVQRWRFKAQL